MRAKRKQGAVRRSRPNAFRDTAPSVIFEGLESRRLLSSTLNAITLAPPPQAPLHVIGTRRADRVVLTTHADGHVDVTLNGKPAGTVPATFPAGFHISIDLRGGDDRISLTFVGATSVPVVPMRVRGGPGNDGIMGLAGDDTLSGDEGHDYVSGGDGRDKITGTGGKDKLHGEGGRDTIDGGASSDSISGGDGNDVLRGGNGDDRISGGQGANRAWGGRGADTYLTLDGKGRFMDAGPTDQKGLEPVILVEHVSSFVGLALPPPYGPTPGLLTGGNLGTGGGSLDTANPGAGTGTLTLNPSPNLNLGGGMTSITRPITGAGSVAVQSGASLTSGALVGGSLNIANSGSLSVSGGTFTLPPGGTLAIAGPQPVADPPVPVEGGDGEGVVDRYTLLGDANVDGSVSFEDLVKLAEQYQTGGQGNFVAGDFSYDGNIGVEDSVVLSQNYNPPLTP